MDNLTMEGNHRSSGSLEGATGAPSATDGSLEDKRARNKNLIVACFTPSSVSTNFIVHVL